MNSQTNTIPWVRDAIFYHIYPLGLLGSPRSNDHESAPTHRLSDLVNWRDYLQDLGVTAVYLGPVFESESHGYDTVDYRSVDRRLGTNEDLTNLVATFHQAGIKVVVDGVFNHVGRSHHAFRDLLERGVDSEFSSWFANLRWGERSPYGDPFSYEGWAGHHELVKLDTGHEPVQDYLLGIVEFWIEQFHFDGIRLDAADVLDHRFMERLRAFVDSRVSDFWLMGEVVHGDYNAWASPGKLHAATNYECYKGLYSSHNDGNYFEIAWSLNRQFGEGGVYRDLDLYSFVDNHDVDRIASRLEDNAHFYPLHILLFTMPGVPSLYYGSEWGIEGKRSPHSDSELRPVLRLSDLFLRGDADKVNAIKRLIQLRSGWSFLREGRYRQEYVADKQLSFSRTGPDGAGLVVVNASGDWATVPLGPDWAGKELQDLLNGETVPRAGEVNIPPHWGRVLVSAQS